MAVIAWTKEGATKITERLLLAGLLPSKEGMTERRHCFHPYVLIDPLYPPLQRQRRYIDTNRLPAIIVMNPSHVTSRATRAAKCANVATDILYYASDSFVHARQPAILNGRLLTRFLTLQPPPRGSSTCCIWNRSAGFIKNEPGPESIDRDSQAIRPMLEETKY